MDVSKYLKYINRRNIYSFVILTIFSLLSFICGYYVNKNVSKDVIINEKEVGTMGKIESSCTLWVEVVGAVNKSDVYCMDSGSLVIDAIKKAGGYSKTYAKKYVERNINLAKEVANNEKIYIPESKDLICEFKLFEYEKEVQGVGLSTAGGCVSINNGTKNQLISLSGVGDATAQKIINGRPYKKVEDLLNVSGIGESLLAKIKKDICI